LGEIAGAIANRVTQQIIADIKAGATANNGGQAETEEIATEESGKPDLSWIPGYVDGIGSTLQEQGLRRAAISAIKEEMRTCLEFTVKSGSSRSEAIGLCQYILDEIKEDPTDTPEPEVEEENIRSFAGAWHGGGLCGEDDDPAYRWNVDLQQDANGVVTGVISFHACPGGGAVYYDVTGQATSDKKLVLQGTKTSGRGGLMTKTPKSVQFTLKYKGEPSPSYTR